MKAKNKRPAKCMRRVMSKFRPFHRIASPQACATCAFHSLSSKFDYSQCRLLSSMKNSPLRLKSMLANQGQVFPRPGLGKTVGFMDSLLPCNEISVTRFGPPVFASFALSEHLKRAKAEPTWLFIVAFL